MKINKLLMTLFLSLNNYQLYAEDQNKPIEPVMVTIPSGSFEMGSTKRENTQPIHNVNISQFSMGKFEVTVSEFRQFAEATNYPAPTDRRY